MKYFIELGSAYFNTLLAQLGPDPAWQGVTVDARSEWLDKLPNYPNVEKVCAIVTHDDAASGKLHDFYYVPSALVALRGLPQWLDGCGSTNREHTILSLFSDKAVAHTQIAALSVKNIFDRIPTKQPDFVKIDLEGSDYDVVTMMLNLDVRPASLEFEHVHMLPLQLQTLSDRLVQLGYRLHNKNGDSICFVLLAQPGTVPGALPSVLIVCDPIWSTGSIAKDLQALLPHRCIQLADWAKPINTTNHDIVLCMTLTCAAAGYLAPNIVHVCNGPGELELPGVQALAARGGLDGVAVGGVSRECVEAVRSAFPHARTFDVPASARLSRFTKRMHATPPIRAGFIGFPVTENMQVTGMIKKPEVFLAICAAANLTPVFSEKHFTYETMQEFYDNIDVLICTSSIEGGPLGPFEAIACGVPVISTDVGYVHDAALPGRFASIDEAVALLKNLVGLADQQYGCLVNQHSMEHLVAYWERFIATQR